MLYIHGLMVLLCVWYEYPLTDYSKGNDIEFINNNVGIVLQDIASAKCVSRT